MGKKRKVVIAMFARLAEICASSGGLWSADAECYLLENAPKIMSKEGSALL